jgi:hypothetical protein
MTERRSLPGRASTGEVKIKVKGSGRGRPLYTGKVKSNVNSGCCKRLWFPLLARDARNGAPRSGEIGIKINVKGNGQSLP